MSRHTQVEAKFNGREVHVDEEMLPVLELLWARGIVTLFSCQGDVPPPAGERSAWSNMNRSRAYVQMLRTRESLCLIQEMALNFEPLEKGEVFWSFNFDTWLNEQGRVTIYFPHVDTSKFVEFLKTWAGY